jgi:hypothetical protein
LVNVILKPTCFVKPKAVKREFTFYAQVVPPSLLRYNTPRSY